ncbi:MAG TPA: glycosyl hydrolase family 28-related protein [Xanthobacteraceae bacterium]|nr:glycosyl hydrolase family 28-related protein [Xanthobacteraceae bacterium]
MTGHELDLVTTISVSRVSAADTDVTAEERPVVIQQANPSSLKFIVPPDLAPGVYRVKAQYPHGTLSLRLNLPTVYWMQGDQRDAVSPGGDIDVFGRNIVRNQDRARLELTSESGGTVRSLAITSGDLWRARFRIPDDMNTGFYRARIFNGDGGAEDSADAGRIEIRQAEPISSKVVDVRAFRAVGDGKTDSTRAVKAALAEAGKHGGTVYFPRGRYLLSTGLVIPDGVHIKGERNDLVNIVWPNFPKPPDVLIKAGSRFMIEDVTLYAANHFHIISAGFKDETTEEPGDGDIVVRRVRIRAFAFGGFLDGAATGQRMAEFKRRYPWSSAPDLIRLSGNHLEVSDCDIAGSGRSLFLFKARNAVIARNVLSNGRYGWYSITGSSRVVFENNRITASDLQGNGGGINTLSNAVSASENIYVGHNVFTGLYGLDREGVTTDGPGGYYFGRARSTAPDQLALADSWNKTPVSEDPTGALVMVVNGTGAGQSARVARYDKATPESEAAISLDRPLQVPLDATSEITIAQAHQNYLIVENSFEDSGVAAQTYGIGLDHVIAGNTSTRTGGFFAIGLTYSHFQPNWHIQLLDNRIIEGNVFRIKGTTAVSEEAAIGVHAYQAETRRGRPPLGHAIIVRGNRLEQDAHIELKGASAASPGLRDIIVEDNTMGASRTGLIVDAGVASWLGRRNVLERLIPR